VKWRKPTMRRANRMEQESAGEYRDAAGSEETQQKRSAEGQVDVTRIVKARNDLRMENAEGERRNRQNESHEGTGSATSKSARAYESRTSQNERAERANERRKGIKKGSGADVMMAAGKKWPSSWTSRMARRVRAKAGPQRGPRDVCKKCEGVENPSSETA